jgi:acyl-CoA-binding protein
MSELDQAFAQAQRDVTALAADPGNEVKLALYALYKQATVGDVTGKKPSRLDMVGRAKYDAWAKTKGLSSEEAMQRYVDQVATLRG